MYRKSLEEKRCKHMDTVLSQVELGGFYCIGNNNTNNSTSTKNWNDNDDDDDDDDDGEETDGADGIEEGDD